MNKKVKMWSEVDALDSNYTVLEASLHWMGVEGYDFFMGNEWSVPEGERGLSCAIYHNSDYPGLENRCRAIVTALDQGVMKGNKYRSASAIKSSDNWTVSGFELKRWMLEVYETERPFYLFGTKQGPVAEGVGSQQADDDHDINTKTHNGRRAVIIALAEALIEDSLDDKHYKTASAIEKALLERGKVLPVDVRTLAGYLREK